MTSHNVRLDKMSHNELFALKTDIDAQLTARRQDAITELRTKMESAAKDIGLSFKDVFGKGKGGKVAVKYRDPKNVGNTWTGRGRQPRWLTAALKASKGTKLEDFAVKAA